MLKITTLLLLGTLGPGCKTDVGPKKKVASEKIASRKGTLWKQAHVLAVRRVKKGKYGGRGGIGSYRRGFMRYHLVLEGGPKNHRVFLFEAVFVSKKSQGKGVHTLRLKGSADDRCVAYSKDGGKKWRIVRHMAKGLWLHLPLPEIETKADQADPCAQAPAPREHFLAQLKGDHRLYSDEMPGVLALLALRPKDEGLHVAFARFMLTESRHQYFLAGQKNRWRPVQRIACDQPRLRKIYLDRVKEHRLSGKWSHRNAVLVLEHCPIPELQDGLADLLWKNARQQHRSTSHQETARVFARVTDARKAASPAAIAAAIKALSVATPDIQAYIVRALGAVGGKVAHAALRKRIGQLEASGRSGAPAQAAKLDWPSFDDFVKRVKSCPMAKEKDLVLRTAHAALKK